jgi:hypothetical protein
MMKKSLKINSESQWWKKLQEPAFLEFVFAASSFIWVHFVSIYCWMPIFKIRANNDVYAYNMKEISELIL